MFQLVSNVIKFINKYKIYLFSKEYQIYYSIEFNNSIYILICIVYKMFYMDLDFIILVKSVYRNVLLQKKMYLFCIKDIKIIMDLDKLI